MIVDIVTVKPGDSLYRIAETCYGDPEKWPLIYCENQREIGGNPHLIFPGTILRIPSNPT